MSSTQYINTLSLRTPDLSSLTDFYKTVLGMQPIIVQKDAMSFAFDPGGCELIFRQIAESDYVARPDSFYWKIGITVKNLPLAVEFLRDNGIEATDPKQFQDIGYLSHIRDPQGFTIELLQHGFQGKEQTVPNGHPIGAQATLAHITLRVTDLVKAQHYFEKTLGMHLLSVQPVSDYGFCLYFYAWSDETLPDPDLESVNNREWLWARPYTLIELQHLQSTGAAVHKEAPDEAGFDGFSYMPTATSEPVIISPEDLDSLS